MQISLYQSSAKSMTYHFGIFGRGIALSERHIMREMNLCIFFYFLAKIEFMCTKAVYQALLPSLKLFVFLKDFDIFE